MSFDLQLLQSYQNRMAMVRSIDPEYIIPLEKRQEVTIKEVRKGGVVLFNQKTYLVTNVAHYTEMDEKFKKKKTFQVTELTLFCLGTGEVEYIEWSIDDSLDIFFTTKKLSNEEMRNKILYDNKEVVDLDDIDEIVDDEENLTFNNRIYAYDDDWSSIFESEDGRKSYVFFGEFGDENTGFLTIEGWNDNPQSDEGWEYEVFLSVKVMPQQIMIISTGEKT